MPRRSGGDARSQHTVPLVGIAVAVLLANLPALLHLVTANPLVIDAALTPPVHGLLPGQPYIDPNTGFTTQALGHLAALDWLHGHIPWWNPYEGIGAPLAGEMQSGAFFPATLLLAFHQGVLLLELVLEMASGWATYFLVRRLGTGRTVATAAGVAFGLCGTFAWLTHAPMRPIAFLPLALLGVEHAVDSGRERTRGGWVLLAIALALSILAGFPETTLIDGMLVAWWAVLRLGESSQPTWLPIIGRLATGLVVGIAVAAPLLAAFTAYLPSADVGGHSSGFSFQALPSQGLTQVVLPYSLGPIFGFDMPPTQGQFIGVIWGNAGGYLSATLIAAGIVGLVGRRHRVLRLGLGVWILISLLRTFGWPPLLHAMALVPGFKAIAFYRYANPSWELAVVVLAAFGLDDIARATTRRRALTAAAIVAGMLAAWAAVTAWPLMRGAIASPPFESTHPEWYVVGSFAGAGVALGVLVTGGVFAARRSSSSPPSNRAARARDERTRRRGRILMADAVSLESVVLLAFPYLSAPKPTDLQLESVAWLQQHLGTSRFYTLGPIQPDYGSYYTIGQANVNDLPLPKAWVDYIAHDLDPNAPRGTFTGTVRSDPQGPTPAQELTTHLSGYEAVGTRYVVENANGLDSQGQPFPRIGSPVWPLGPRLVHRDQFAEIWELPGAAPLFSADSGCAVRANGWDQVTVTCAHPSRLVRRVQYVPGWTASVNGTSVPVRVDTSGPAKLFQEVDVPAGRSTVHFTYLPPNARIAIGASVLATLFLVAFALIPRVARRQGRNRVAGGRSQLV